MNTSTRDADPDAVPGGDLEDDLDELAEDEGQDEPGRRGRRRAGRSAEASQRESRTPFDKGLLREPLSVLPARRPLVLSADAPVSEAIRVMQSEHRGVVVVTEDGTPASRLTGIFSERDVLLRVAGRGRNPATLRLAEVMTENPERLPVESSIAWVLNKMCVGGFRHVPVVDANDRPVFVISVRDVVEFLVESFPREVLNLPLEYGADRQRDREGA